MQTIRPLAALLGSLALASCGARDGLGVGLPAGTPAVDASTDAPVVGPPDAGLTLRGLDGWWMTEQIGNCISAEEWLHFAQPAGFVQTVVDRNFCGPHSVTRHDGLMSVLPDHVVGVTWTDAQETQMSQRTMAVLDPAGKLVGGSFPDPSYVRGTRALAAGAFSRPVPGHYLRRDWWRRAQTQGAAYGTFVTIALGVAPPPDAAKAGDTCTLTLQLWARVEVSGSIEMGTESLKLDCSYRTTPDLGWLEIVARPTPSSPQGFWYDALTQAGVWKHQPARVADLMYASFMPELLAPPGQPDVLVMPRDIYGEMLSDPPASIK